MCWILQLITGRQVFLSQDPNDFLVLSMSHPNLIPLRIEKINREAEGAKTFVLHNLSGKALPYLPGQFLTFVFPNKHGGEDRRSYSLSSSPSLAEPMMITVKRVANGAYSRWLIDKAVAGDQLYTTGASGYFVLPEAIAEYRQLVFFAAGSGITPVYALIKTVLHSHSAIRMKLLYSNVSVSQTIFYAALMELQALYPLRLEVDFLFSKGEPRQRLNVGMIERIADAYSAHSLFYLCGPIDYMRTIAIVLRTAGVDDRRIRKEIFHSEKPVIKELPPDELPHSIRAIVGDREFVFTTQYPATILQTARALKIPLPYSCEAGQCGTCSATCVSGKVWMWHNDVLLDEEMDKGRILTCTGYAVGGDVELRF